jgi:hypothetical protein
VGCFVSVLVFAATESPLALRAWVRSGVVLDMYAAAGQMGFVNVAAGTYLRSHRRGQYFLQ